MSYINYELYIISYEDRGTVHKNFIRKYGFQIDASEMALSANQIDAQKNLANKRASPQHRLENSSKSLKTKSVISVTKCDDPSDYESDEYNDSDYNYNPGNLSAKNETLLEEIIIIGNVSYSLDDLPTYNVTINLNLPEIKPLKETVLKYPLDRTIHGRLLITDGQLQLACPQNNTAGNILNH